MKHHRSRTRSGQKGKHRVWHLQEAIRRATEEDTDNLTKPWVWMTGFSSLKDERQVKDVSRGGK